MLAEILKRLDILGYEVSQIKQIALDTQKSAQANQNHPRSMLQAFKTDTFQTALNQAYTARLTASSDLIVSDANNFSNPLEKSSQTQLFVSPFGGLLRGSDVDGALYGLSIGLTHIADSYIAQGHFSYANGSSSQDLITQSTNTSANLFQLGGFYRLFFGALEADFNANFLLGKFELENAWISDSSLNSTANFSNYQGNLGTVLGYRFGENLSFKPFLGAQFYYEKQDEFSQNGGLGLVSDGYSSTMIDALIGGEARYIFDSGAFAFVKMSYENRLHDAHKEHFVRLGNENLRYENESYDNLINANLGAQLNISESFKISAEAFYKHYNTGLNYFGGNLGFKFGF